jgi:hypothetical protein
LPSSTPSGVNRQADCFADGSHLSVLRFEARGDRVPWHGMLRCPCPARCPRASGGTEPPDRDLAAMRVSLAAKARFRGLESQISRLAQLGNVGEIWGKLGPNLGQIRPNLGPNLGPISHHFPEVGQPKSATINNKFSANEMQNAILSPSPLKVPPLPNNQRTPNLEMGWQLPGSCLTVSDPQPSAPRLKLKRIPTPAEVEQFHQAVASAHSSSLSAAKTALGTSLEAGYAAVQEILTDVQNNIMPSCFSTTESSPSSVRYQPRRMQRHRRRLLTCINALKHLLPSDSHTPVGRIPWPDRVHRSLERLSPDTERTVATALAELKQQLRDHDSEYRTIKTQQAIAHQQKLMDTRPRLAHKSLTSDPDKPDPPPR